RSTAGAMVSPITVVDAEPPRLFSFRWVYPSGDVPAAGNSLLVTFELVPSGPGTMVRMSETGFREMGWEAAVLQAQYNDHVDGWTTYLPRIGTYVARLISAQCPSPSTTTSGRRSGTQPGVGCSTCS